MNDFEIDEKLKTLVLSRTPRLLKHHDIAEIIDACENFEDLKKVMIMLFENNFIKLGGRL